MLSERDIVLTQVKAQMDKATNDMRSELDCAMFKDSPFIASIKIKPISKYKIYWNKIKFYFITLWKAIKGTELEEPNDDY